VFTFAKLLAMLSTFICWAIMPVAAVYRALLIVVSYILYSVVSIGRR
jgi:hypothetical protein